MFRFNRMQTIWAALLCLSVTLTARAQTQWLDWVEVIVNDGVVLHSQIEERLDQVMKRFAGQPGAPSREELRDRVREQLILESIQLQKAERAGIRVSDRELDEAVAGIARQNGMTLEQFRKALEADGVPFAQAREQIRREMLLVRIQQHEVRRRVRVTEQEVESYLKSAAAQEKAQPQYHLGHILIEIPKDATPEQIEALRQKAQALSDQLNNGADFAAVAARESAASTALNGGDLGWRKASELPTLFADVVPTLKKGQVSAPLETRGGFHLVKLIDVKSGAEKWVEQRRVRHILIAPNAIRSDAQARERARELYEQLRAGADFEELARTFSDDKVAASAGGDLGWVSPGQMVKPFEEVMYRTPKGQMSEPFKTRFGWHILEVTDIRTVDLGDQVQSNEARAVLQQRKYDEALQDWLREIRGEAYVEYVGPNAPAGKESGE
ncbi:MAG: molecular chaperone SurA [Gammaproteobacteria bacterium]|nr:MAG: molecular chaperone SurA [Gammaproteobacteria bacterium]